MYSLTCHCSLKNDMIDDVVKHTLNWIPKVQNNYDEPKYYEAFQDERDPSILTYFMTFTSKEDERRIADMHEPRKFGQDLYAMCKTEPRWIEHNLVNSIRNSRPESKIHTRVEYTVKSNCVAEVKEEIVKFIDTVRKSETDIWVYESYQNKKEPSKFIHLAEFKDKTGEQYHKDAPHTKKFAEFLYPLCEKEPDFIYMKPVGSARR